ncbi:protein of unknown function DUF1549 [Chthoniobacter flavus Ellin428]|uniref:Fucolectin tachylectin-4 pentraxin-1 domain-containing protein n=1 Tax=Chthoniobacter flavus Ellin428 TaxID=497964 RepID=B4D768_9BACT|nr:DUF1553 domain-containing protein [Chthoniobacter flavus]EDY17719.1 protein of unknown function DUF1549 [Chthoniobacter flavus Ellin428]TCO87044.1 F5/8 type C domain-containing protein [Chthoniobacter flavus]
MFALRRSLLALLSILSPWPAGVALAADKVDFNYDIRPLISSKCYHCHGPDEKSRKAKLRLDKREDAVKEHESGVTIVPGDPAKSELMNRILSKDPDDIMPPPKEQHALTAQEVDLFRRWIAEGAEYKPHWSFVKPTRADVPPLPAGARADNAIDHFIAAKLATVGLKQSPEADRYSLIRRVALDLTGLPPTPEETEAFVNDRSQDAYEKVVDRLLASPAYGERWAKLWLDLARYADSSGYGSDFVRLNIWPYRDWMINAFNRNLPYDQFTIEQLAGDLLPNPTTEQLVATAFHRNTMTNFEGGTIDEEFRVAAVKDRIATTGEVWMGLTVGCAQCHSHKFDPISQTDYYSFFGVFNQSEDADRNDEEPKMPLPTAEETAKTTKLKDDIAKIEAELKETTSPELEGEEVAWEKEAAKPIAWQPLQAAEIKAASQTTFDTLPDGSLLARGEMPEKDTYTIKVRTDLPGITAFRLEALPDDSLPAHGPGRADNGNAALTNFHVAMLPADSKLPRGRFVRVSLPGVKKLLALAEVQVFSNGENVALKGTAKQSSTAYGGDSKRAIDGNTEGDFFKAQSVSHTNQEKDPWWEVDLGSSVDIERIAIWNRTDSNLGARLANFHVSVLDEARKPVWEQVVVPAPSPSIALKPADGQTIALRDATADFNQEGWPVSKAIDGDEKSGWAFAPQSGHAHAAVFQTEKPLKAKEAVLQFTLDQNYGQKHTLGHFRLLATTQAQPVRELPGHIKEILAVAAESRSAAQQAEVMNYFRPLSKTYAGLGKQLEAKRAELAAVKPLLLPIMRELPSDKQRETHILNKGNYLVPMDKVEPGLLSQFASFVPKDAKMDRLTAARWLMSPENPLTARVAVNRFWAQLFGLGIVETQEDFGSQGALPTHPALLDWLAVTFMSPKSDDPAHPGLAWDMKGLLKLMVMSATYRQASKVNPDTLEKDPRNRLLSYAPRRRLEAETVRDQALAVSGLLSHKMFGPSVYPPQPDGLWKVAFNGGQNAYPTSKGEDRYRRGLYTFWRRSMPPPDMTTFDAPSRESCTLRRIPTNTPLQAFVTMNDPVFVECAQALGRRMMHEGGNDPEARVRFALRLCLDRPPTDTQVMTLVDLYEKELSIYQTDKDGALKLATEPIGALPENCEASEAAAYTVVANVMLNLDSFLTKN